MKEIYIQWESLAELRCVRYRPILMAQLNHLFDVDSLNLNQIEILFSKAKNFKTHRITPNYVNKLVALLFLEPSTRTKLSFEVATLRLGAKAIYMDSKGESSLKKGESLEDTFWTIHAMNPDAIIVRSDREFDLLKSIEKSKIPIINAGYADVAHPTQALLDAFTLRERFGSQKLKLLMLGDVSFSRVARSDIKLFEKLGYEIAICSPNADLLAKEHAQLKVLDKIEDALKWCDVCMGLRTQWERHKNINLEDLKKNYQLNEKNISLLNPKSVVMHPGPIRWGEEFASSIAEHPQMIYRDQVTNGVYIRASVLDLIWSEKNV